MKPLRPMLALVLCISTLPARGTDNLGSDRSVETFDEQIARISDLDLVDGEGVTPLMHAVRSGRLDVARWCLWSGANPLAKDAQGRTARAYLPKGHEAYASLSLLIRAWEYASAHCQPIRGLPTRPSLVLIDDGGVDFNHPDLSEHFEVNAAEAKGQAGVDDDGNGFIDDIHGWNFSIDLPMLRPAFAEWDSPEYRPYFEQWLTYSSGEDGGDRKPPSASLPNPFNRRFVEGDFNLAAEQVISGLMSASHGSHVAGIIVQQSRRKARICSAVFSAALNQRAVGDQLFDEKAVAKLAQESESFEVFYHRYRNALLADATEMGKRYSQFISGRGVGIVNMSYGEHREAFSSYANVAQEIYRQHGKNPETLDAALEIDGIDLEGDLGLELFMARSVFYLIAMRENPDVLFVVAAGNEGEDNDTETGSPDYFSWIFPNVISVASLPEAGSQEVSEFSNFGRRTVQVAAPGENIVSAMICGLRGPMSGTSMAAPAVSGIAARVRASKPSLTGPQLRYLLETTATSRDSFSDQIVAGEVDGDKALLQAGSISTIGPAALAVWEQQRFSGAPALGPAYVEATRIAINAAAPGRNRVTTLAGYPGGWAAVVSQSEEKVRQSVFLPSDASEVVDATEKRAEREWGVTAMAGNADAFAAVMEERETSLSIKMTREFDPENLKDASERAGHFRAVTGTYGPILLLQESEVHEGSDGQEYEIHTGNLTVAELAGFVSEHAKNGLVVESISGDNNRGHPSMGRWHFILKKADGNAKQRVLGPSKWPEKEVVQLQESGYRIVSIGGSTDQWVIVLSTGTDLGPQKWKLSEDFPGTWIEEQWKEGTAQD